MTAGWRLPTLSLEDEPLITLAIALAFEKETRHTAHHLRYTQLAWGHWSVDCNHRSCVAHRRLFRFPVCIPCLCRRRPIWRNL